MHVDSITNAVNLRKLNKKYSSFFTFCKTFNLTETNRLDLMDILKYFNTWDINLHRKNDDIISINQLDYFKMVDLVSLIRMRTPYRLSTSQLQVIDACNQNIGVIATDIYDFSESYIDEYDVQPFRHYLFMTDRATLEMSNIFMDLGFTDETVTIDNYKNVIDFSGRTIIDLLLVFANWVQDYESHVERLYSSHAY